MHDLIIIGGGPAAVSAGCYALEKRIDFVMLFEEFGGRAGPIPSSWEPRRKHYLPRDEVMFTLARHVSDAPEHLIHDRALKVTRLLRGFAVETVEHGTLEGLVVLVATGATPRTLPLPDAQRLLDPRLQYSISTYAHLVAGERVAVIGDTARALHGVAEMARTAAKVYVIVPDSTHLATSFGQTLRRQPNIEVLEGYEVTGISGGATIEALLLVRDGNTRRLEVDHAFVSLGLYPNSEIVEHLVDTGRNRFILVNEHHETTMPGLFAAGDVTTNRSEQVLVSIGDGARAAARAYDHLLAQRLIYGPLWGQVEAPISG